jgi:hypothetical protein
VIEIGILIEMVIVIEIGILIEMVIVIEIGILIEMVIVIEILIEIAIVIEMLTGNTGGGAVRCYCQFLWPIMEAATGFICVHSGYPRQW